MLCVFHHVSSLPTTVVRRITLFAVSIWVLRFENFCGRKGRSSKTLDVASKDDTYEELTVGLRNPVDTLCDRMSRRGTEMLPVVVLVRLDEESVFEESVFKLVIIISIITTPNTEHFANH
jgi:hypothetical protein